MDITPTEFEKLLCEFCKQDVPDNFTVRHNIRETGGESGNKRQIDTIIRGKLGISDITICGEAKNWNAEVGSEVIDGIVGKYLSGEIRANKVIIFSNYGYSQPAIDRSKLLGIELLQPKEFGKPVSDLPYIVSIAYLGQMVVTVTHEGPQPTFMTVSEENYVILNGKERISLRQFVYRQVVNSLRQLPQLNLANEVGKVTIKKDNVLYELKDKPGYRYNAHFEAEINLKWDFFALTLPGAVLTHINSGNELQVNLQGDDMSVLNKILLSDEKRNYETREDCISNELSGDGTHFLLVCLPDPDQHLTNPQNPIFALI